MFKILILEDEVAAAGRLIRMLKEIEPGMVVLDTIQSVSSSVKWLQQHPCPDIIFSDIQLTDGPSFEIFKQIRILCPIIFITAHDEFAIDAFKLNSVDYLLKPVKKEELQKAVEKFKKLTLLQSAPVIDISGFISQYEERKTTYKNRFLVKYGSHIKTISTEDIAYFYTKDRITFLATEAGSRYAIDLNMDGLETVLDPKFFFRINRQFIISLKGIVEMKTHSKSRVLIKLSHYSKEKVIVSAERSADFKRWLDDAA